MSKLNPEQKKAVQYSSGPLLIIAGPGTGKTMVLTHRLAYLIQKKKVDPAKILAVTFTSQAAQEMEARTDQLLPFSAFNWRAGTFHSLGEEVLREYGLEIGLSPNFRLLDEKGSWLLMRRFWERFELSYYRPLGNPGPLISALLTHFSRCKDEGITPEDYTAYWKKFRQREKDRSEIQRVKDIARAYQVYQKLLLENQALDFGDLINQSRQLLEKRPKVLENFRQRWSFILVDEFQDTNWAQYQLLKLIAPPENNLTVCASEDQAIYQWRGASFTNILQFIKDYPQARVVVLRDNYRSQQEILDVSYQFIQLNNPNRLEYQARNKKEGLKINNHLRAVRKGRAKVEVLRFSSGQAEIAGVAKKAQSLLKKVSPQEIAILGRTHQSLRPFEEALRQAGIDCQVQSSVNIYQQPLALDILGYLRLLENRFDDAVLYRVLQLPCWQLSPSSLARLMDYHQRRGQPLFRSLGEITSRLSPVERKRVQAFLARIEKDTIALQEEKLSSVLVSILEETSWLKRLLHQKKEKELVSLNEFFRRVKEFEEETSEGRLHDFLLQVEQEREAGAPDKKNLTAEEDPESVKIMTVHAAKGLEFSYVFLVGLVNQRFPSSQKREAIPFPTELVQEKLPEGDLHLQEERRLFYVAMTRAKKGLFFTWADDYGGVRKKKPSRFLREMEEELKGKEKKEKDIPERKQKPLQQKPVSSLPKYFSFTQFKSFQTCPQQYRFTHLLKLPSRGGPERSFGQSLHKVLEAFLRDYSLQPRFKADWPQLLKIYEENWIADWYESEKQEKDFFQKGKKQLRNFFRDFQKNPPPLWLANGRPWLEKDFSFSLARNLFKGRIDRVDKIEGGVEIIDYKTGLPQKRLNADRHRQLLIYQIAAEEALHLLPQRLTFYYLQDGSRLSFLGCSEEKEKTKKEIAEVIREVKKSSFPPRPGYYCRFCDYRRICDRAQ